MSAKAPTATGPRLVLATANQHKTQEILDILSARIEGLDANLIVSMSDFQIESPVEDGLSFAENATIKARAVAAATGLPALADDSGLIVSAMGAAPGIFSARWAGHGATDQENLSLLLDQLSDLQDVDRKARFVCAAAIALPDGTTVVEEGEMHGKLLSEARGVNGFGYDPAFVPLGSTRTTAEFSPEEKNQISHRARALTALVPRIREVLEG